MQVFVALDVFASHNFRGVGNYFFRESDFPGNFHGERASRIANLQLEEGTHFVAVVEHGSVHHAFVVFGKMLQVLVVGGDNSKGTFQVETLQDGFGNGPANLRFRSSSELINQDEALAVA